MPADWTHIRIRRETYDRLAGEAAVQELLYAAGRSGLACSDRHGITFDTVIRYALDQLAKHRERAGRAGAKARARKGGAG